MEKIIINNLLDQILYIEKVVKINQSVTVLKKDNKAGKKLVKELKKFFIGGIDGFNNGAAFVGLLPCGEFLVNLKPNKENEFYITYKDYRKGGAGFYLSGFMVTEFLKGINALEKKAV